LNRLTNGCPTDLIDCSLKNPESTWKVLWIAGA